MAHLGIGLLLTVIAPCSTLCVNANLENAGNKEKVISHSLFRKVLPIVSTSNLQLIENVFFFIKGEHVVEKIKNIYIHKLYEYTVCTVCTIWQF